MIGYVYLDNDNNLNIRNADYIEVEDPTFWGRNAHFINIVWKFDTESPSNMHSLLTSLKEKTYHRTVADFCKAIGFDLDTFIKSQQK